ncbi:MAG TPA: hypothetical protein VK714_03715 [Myxococcota bacterium]|nr:hypothetical protein [Myxococcota bacterium]
MDTTVRFVAMVPPYNAGETATFDDAQAAKLISKGLAVSVGDGGTAYKASANTLPSDPTLRTDYCAPTT